MDAARDAMLAALAWQVELGADEAIGDAFVDRTVPVPKPEAKAQPALALVADGAHPADGCADLDALRAAIENHEHPLKHGARACVFSDGNPAARIMIVGEAPGRNEDIEGRPFVGTGGQLLDRMLGAIGLSRHAEDPAKAVYITNIVPWRPAQNRTPSPAESAAFLPYVRRHIELIDPAIIVTMGNTPTRALLDPKAKITSVRGKWDELTVGDTPRPCLPMLHPAYLLRQPMDKHKAWTDLLTLQAGPEV